MDAAKELGMEVVQAWRNSLKARPPPMKKEDEIYPGKDRRYEDLSEDQIPLTESLMDCMDRGTRILLAVFHCFLQSLTSMFHILSLVSSSSMGICNQKRD